MYMYKCNICTCVCVVQINWLSAEVDKMKVAIKQLKSSVDFLQNIIVNKRRKVLG